MLPQRSMEWSALGGNLQTSSVKDADAPPASIAWITYTFLDSSSVSSEYKACPFVVPTAR
jgi:hypothetical protein